MKNVLVALGIVFLVLVCGGGAFFGYVAYWGNHLDATSKTYVDESVPAIVSTWSKDELTKRASPQLREKITDDQIDTLFSKLRSGLGAFQSYDGSKGDSKANFNLSGTKMTIGALYTANATFQNGKIEIEIQLTQQDGKWEILGFHVNIKGS